MKKTVAIFLSIFFIAVIIILGYGLLIKDKSDQNTGTLQKKAAVDQPFNANKNAQPAKNYSSEEIALHNTKADCWLIINSKVYDVSGYLKLSAHPGENGTITPYCGKEATQAFDTKDKTNPKPHSQSANNFLDNYYLGDLK
jgi:cytochrome b involved in lipid metabolism